MPAKRQYRVKGTNDFLILAAIFFFLCLWAIKDAWMPSEKVLKKHPMTVDAAFAVAGTVEEVKVETGQNVAEHQVLAILRGDRIEAEYETAKTAFADARLQRADQTKEVKRLTESGASADEIAAAKQKLSEHQKAMDTLLAEVNQLRTNLESTELKSPSKGVVKQVLVMPHSMLAADQVAIVVDPKDHFYLFNKSLTVLSFILFWVFLALHIMAR
jgi:multidrug resistance efflux pump